LYRNEGRGRVIAGHPLPPSPISLTPRGFRGDPPHPASFFRLGYNEPRRSNFCLGGDPPKKNCGYTISGAPLRQPRVHNYESTFRAKKIEFLSWGSIIEEALLRGTGGAGLIGQIQILQMGNGCRTQMGGIIRPGVVRGIEVPGQAGLGAGGRAPTLLGVDETGRAH